MSQNTLLAMVKHFGGTDQIMAEEFTERTRLDRPVQTWDKNDIRLENRLNETCRREVGKIDIALQRMGSGTYGLYLACDQLAEIRQLEAYTGSRFLSGASRYEGKV